MTPEQLKLQAQEKRRERLLDLANTINRELVFIQARVLTESNITEVKLSAIRKDDLIWMEFDPSYRDDLINHYVNEEGWESVSFEKRGFWPFNHEVIVFK